MFLLFIILCLRHLDFSSTNATHEPVILVTDSCSYYYVRVMCLTMREHNRRLISMTLGDAHYLAKHTDHSELRLEDDSTVQHKYSFTVANT